MHFSWPGGNLRPATQEYTMARIFDYMRRYGHKKLVMCNDADSGLRAVVAIHSTHLGPAAGGLRMWPYASEEDAILDALRLARGMTYKYAAAGEPRRREGRHHWRS